MIVAAERALINDTKMQLRDREPRAGPSSEGPMSPATGTPGTCVTQRVAGPRDQSESLPPHRRNTIQRRLIVVVPTMGSCSYLCVPAATTVPARWRGRTSALCCSHCCVCTVSAISEALQQREHLVECCREADRAACRRRARLAEHRLLVRERQEAALAVIGADARRAHATERQALVREVPQRIVDGDATGERVSQHALATRAPLAEVVERERMGRALRRAIASSNARTSRPAAAGRRSPPA